MRNLTLNLADLPGVIFLFLFFQGVHPQPHLLNAARAGNTVLLVHGSSTVQFYIHTVYHYFIESQSFSLFFSCVEGRVAIMGPSPWITFLSVLKRIFSSMSASFSRFCVELLSKDMATRQQHRVRKSHACIPGGSCFTINIFVKTSDNNVQSWTLMR